jgi:TrpR-related protein YerC/YecD
MSGWNNKKTENLLEVILSLRDMKEIKSFLCDLMTERENIEFGNRWQAAQMLYNNFSYSEIEKQTGLSSRTIARVAKCLNKGKGGYRSTLQRRDNHPSNSFFRKELC